jgi:hypothetical protein
MKIAFFTEGGYSGKHDRNNTNARTDVAWMIALDAEHHPLFDMNSVRGNSYDLGIFILPKKNINKLMLGNYIENAKVACKKVAIMQEGPNWYWQDYTMEEQIWYFNMLQSADFLLCHNQSDVNYYKGLTGLNTYVMPSLMIEDTVKDITTGRYLNMDEVMIGGNMTSWYGGFDSMIVASEFNCEITAPSMGRKIPREEELEITHLPYMNWTEWIDKLSMAKYGVHLMRTHAAGTFALNCGYLGIPCIGYKGLDTQETIHPDCTVDVGDIETAKLIANRLKDDQAFYNMCKNQAKINYNQYHEENYVKTMNSIFIKEGIQ